jgi:hypothetical protein
VRDRKSGLLEIRLAIRPAHPENFMNWGSAAGLLGIAGAFSIALGALAKRTIERLLDAKIKEMEERHKLWLAELTRRQAHVFDEQFVVLKTLLSMTYRLRNAVKELKAASREQRQEIMPRIVAGACECEEMLIANRAIIPHEIFRIAHTLKGSAMMVEPGDPEVVAIFIKAFDDNFSHLSTLIVRHILGE